MCNRSLFEASNCLFYRAVSKICVHISTPVEVGPHENCAKMLRLLTARISKKGGD